MSDQIKVAIKLRPLIEREQFENVAWSVVDNTIFQIDPSTRKRKGDIYKFDHIFDSFSRNEDVFDTLVKTLVDAAVGGFNATVFAYGQTSSGKTYTMSGDETECGVIQMAISHMFEAMKQSGGREFLARASHLEIYNEKVRDLLGSDKTTLQIREVEGNVVVSNLKEELVADVSKTIDLMKKGERKRQVGETAMNEKSSRSHSIFRIIIESRDTDEGDAGAIQVSQLNFVDLAGSERVNQTGAQGERLKEGCSINRSLFMLGHVISQLSEGQRSHINFRDSKLTRILQPSLGGNALTVIICTVTPAAIEETHCTLGFASRAKNIKNEPHLNEVLSDGTLLKRYARQLSKLKAELQEAKASNFAQEFEAMENKLEEKDKHNRLLQARIDLLTKKLISGATTKDRKEAFKRRRTWCAPSARLSFLPTSLATIEEATSPCEKRVDILESSLTSQFQIPLEEFELQLLSAECDSVSSEYPIIADVMQSPISESTNGSIDTVLSCPHVTSRSRRKRDSELHIDQVKSPVGICHAGCQTDPTAISCEGTPRNELRDRISFWKNEHDLMTVEYDELRQYTRLECDSIKEVFEELEKSRQEVIKTREENDQLKTELFNEKVTAKMRIHELEILNRQSNQRWETLDMEFLSDVPTTPDGKELKQLKEENTRCIEIIAEKETANRLLEEQLEHMSIVLAEISETKNCIVSQKDKNILALQEEMSLLKADLEAHKQERVSLVAAAETVNKLENDISNLKNIISEKNEKLISLQEKISLPNISVGEENLQVSRLSEEIAHLSLMIEKKDQRIIDLEERLVHASLVTTASETLTEMENEITNLKNVISDKNREILTLQEQISQNTLAERLTEEISVLQDKIRKHCITIKERDQKILDLEEQALKMSSVFSSTATELENEIIGFKMVLSEKNRELMSQDQLSLSMNAKDHEQELDRLLDEKVGKSVIIADKEQTILNLERQLLHVSSLMTADIVPQQEKEVTNAVLESKEVLTSSACGYDDQEGEVDGLQNDLDQHCLEKQLLPMSSVAATTKYIIELQNEIAKLKNVISEKNDEILALNDHISSILNDENRDQRVNRPQEEIAVIIKGKDERIIDLEQEVSHMSSILSSTDPVPEQETEMVNPNICVTNRDIFALKDQTSLSTNAEDQVQESEMSQKEKAQHSAIIYEKDQIINELEKQLLQISSGMPLNELQTEIAELNSVILQKNKEILSLKEKMLSCEADFTSETPGSSMLEEITLFSIGKETRQTTEDPQEHLSRLSLTAAFNNHEREPEISFVDTRLSERDNNVKSLAHIITLKNSESEEIGMLQEELAQGSATNEENEESTHDLKPQYNNAPTTTTNHHFIHDLESEISNTKMAITKKDVKIISLQEDKCVLNTNAVDHEDLFRLKQEVDRWCALAEEKEHIIVSLKEQLSHSSDENVCRLKEEVSLLSSRAEEKEHIIVGLKQQLSASCDKDDFCRLKEEVAQLSAIAEEKEHIIVGLKEQLSLSCDKDDICRLKDEVAELSALAEEKELIIVSLKEQVSHSSDEKVCRLKEEVALLSACAEEKEHIIVGLKEQLSASCDKDDFCRLKEEIGQLTSLAEEKEHIIEDLKEQLSHSCDKEDLCRLKEEVALLSARAEEKEHIIVSLKEQLSLFSDENVCRLKEEVALLSACAEEKEHIIVGLKEQLSASCDKDDFCRLKEEVGQLTSLAEEKEHIIGGLKEQLSHSCDKEDLCRLKEEVAQLSAIAEEKEHIIVGLKEQLSLSCDKDDVCRLKEEVTELSALAEEKEHIIVSLKEQVSHSSDENVCRLKEEISLLSARAEEKEHIIVGLKEQLSASCDKDDFCRLKEEVGQLTSLAEEKEHIIEGLKERLSHSCNKEDLCRLKEEVAQLSAIAEEKERIIVGLKEQLSLSCDKDDFCRLKDEVAELSALAEEKEHIIVSLKEQLSHSSDENVCRLKEEVALLSACAEEKEHIIVGLKEQLSASCDKDDFCWLKEEVGQLTSLAEEKEHIIEGLKERLSHSSNKEDLCRLKEEVAQLSAIAEEKERIIVGLKEQLSLSCDKDDFCRLKEEVAELSALAEEKEHIIVSLKEQVSHSSVENVCRLREEVSLLSARAEEKEHIIVGLKEQLSASCDKDDFCRLKEEVGQLTSLAEEKEHIIEGLKERLSHSCNKEDLCRLKEEVAQLSAIAEEKERIIVGLKEQLSLSCDKDDFCRLKDEVAELSALAEGKEHIIVSLKEQLSHSSDENVCRLKEEVALLSACAEEKEHIIVGLKEQLSASCDKDDFCRLKEEVGQLTSLAEEKEHIIEGLKERLSHSCNKEDLCRLKEEVAQLSAIAEEKERIIVGLKEQLSLSCDKDDFCRLKDEVAELSALAEEKEHIIVSLKEQLSLSSDENVCRLKEEVSLLSARAEEKEHIIVGLKEQLSVSCDKDDFCRLKEEVVQLTSLAEEKEHIIEGLKEQLSHSCDKEDLCRLKEEVGQLSAIAEEKERIIVGLKEQLSLSCDKDDFCRLEDQVAEFSALAEEKEHIIVSLKEQVSHSSDENVCRLKEEVSLLSARAEEKEHIIVGLKEQLSASCDKDDFCRLKEEVGQLTSLAEEKEHIIEGLKEQLSHSCDKEDLCRLKEEVGQLSAIAEEKERIIVGLKEQLSLSCDKDDFCRLEDQVAELSALAEEKEHIIVSLKEQVSHSSDENVCRLKEEVSLLSARAEEKEHIIVGLKEQLSASCDKDDFCRLKEEVGQLTSLAEEKEHIIEGLKERLSHSCNKEDLCRLKEEVAQLSAIAEEKERIIVGLKEQLSLSCDKDDFCRLKDEVAELSALAEEKEHIIVSLKEQLSHSSDENVCRLKEEVALLSACAEEKEHIIVGLKEQLSASCDKDDFCRVKEEVGQLTSLAEEKEHIIEDLKEQLSHSCDKEDLCKLKEEVALLSARAEEKEHIIVGLKEQLSASCDKEDLCRLREEVAQLSAIAEEQEHIIVGLKEQLTLSCDKDDFCRLKEEIGQLTSVAEEKEHIIEGLKEQLSHSCDKEDLCRLKEEVAQLPAIAEEKEHIIVGLKEQLSLSCDKDDVCRLKEEVGQLISLAKEKEHIIEGLKQQLSLSCDKDEFCRLREEVAELSALAEEKKHIIVSLKEQLSHSSDENVCRLKEEVSLLSARAEEKELIIVGLKEQLSVSCETLKELETGISNLIDAISQNDTVILALKEKTYFRDTDIYNKKEKARRFLEEIAQLPSTFCEKEKLVQILEEQMSVMSSLEAKFVNLKDIVSDKQTEYIALKEQMGILNIDSIAEKQGLGRSMVEVPPSSAVVEEREHVIVDVEGQLSVCCETMRELEGGNADLNFAVSQKDLEILSLKEKLSSHDAVVCSEEQETLRLQEEIAMRCAVGKVKDQAIQVLKEQVSFPSTLISDDCVNHEVEINNVRTILADKNNEIAVLNELVTSLKSDLANRMQEIIKLEEEMTMKSAVTKEKEQKILDLEVQLQSILGEITCRQVFNTKTEIVNQKAVSPKENEVYVLAEHLSVEAAVADNQKHESLKEDGSPLKEKQFTSRSSVPVQINLELSQGQIDENNSAIHLLQEELSILSKKLGEERETVKNLQHENKNMKDKLTETVEHRKHLVSEILALDSKFEQGSLEEYQLSDLLKTFCSCIIQKEEEVLDFQIQQRELLVEEKNKLTSRLESLESELFEKEEEYKKLFCAYDDLKVAKDILTTEVEKMMSHLNSVKDDLMGARKEIEKLNCKLSNHKTLEVMFDKLIMNLSAVPELNVHSGHDVLQAVNVLIGKIKNPQTVKDLKWKDCLKEIFEGDNEVTEHFESVQRNEQNLEIEKEDGGYPEESRTSSYSFCWDSVGKCHLTNSVQKMNVECAEVFEIASEIDVESNLAVVIKSFVQRLIAAKEYDNKISILAEQLDCMKQQNELLKKHLDSLLSMEETNKELKAIENINETSELVSNTKDNNSHSLLLNMNNTKQGNKPVLKVDNELHGEKHANNTEWKKGLLGDDGTEREAIKMKLLNKLEDDMNKIRELLASVTELDRPSDIVSSVDMLIKNLRRSCEISEEVSRLRSENDSLRKEITVLKSDIGEIELMLYSNQDKEVNSNLSVKCKSLMMDGQHLKDMLNAKVKIVKEMEKVDRDISELLSSVPGLDLGNGTVNAIQVLVQNFISLNHFKARMNKLEEERSFYEQESIALQKRLECLNLDLQGKGEECNYLQNVLSSEQARVKTLEGEISHYSEYVEKLEIDARKIFELSASELGLDHQNSAFTVFTVVLEKLHTAQKLNEDKFKLEIEFAKVRKENEDMKKEIVELKCNVQDKKEEFLKTQRELEIKQITENEVQCIGILKQELEALKRDLHDFEKQSSNDYELLMMSNLNPAEDLVLAVKFLFQKFKALRNCTGENLKLNKMLNELKQENTIMKENLESMTSEIKKVKENNDDLMKALNDVQAAKEMLLLELKETVSGKQFEIKALKRALNCKSAILETMKDNNAKISTLLSSYPEFYCSTDTVSSISAMIKRLQFCRENHEIKLKDENVFLRQENEAMQKQILLLKSDIESQKQTCKQHSEKICELQSKSNETSSKELKESSNWESFKEEIITKAQTLDTTMEPDLVGIYEQIMNIPEIDFPRNLIPLVTLLTDKLAKQDLRNRLLNNNLDFKTTKHKETLKKIRYYETEIYQMEEKIENLSVAVKQEKEHAENLRSEKVRLQEELDAAVAALTVAKKQLGEVSTTSEKCQTAEKWLAEREEVIANLRLAEKQFSDLGYKRQGDIITRVGSKCSPYQIGSSAKLRIKNLEEQVTELRRQLLEHQEGASGRSLVSVGVNTNKGNECNNCLASQIEIRNLTFEILGLKSKVKLLKDQIEREEFKYKGDAEVLERMLGAAKSKNGELKMEIRRLQAAQEVSFVAGAKEQPTINMCDRQIQTDMEADVVYRMSGEGSGIVNDYVVTLYKEKVKKLLHENELLKDLCRRRLHKLKLLQGQLPPQDKEEMENFESGKENIDCNVNSGKTSDSSTHRRKKHASSSHS